MNYINSNNLSLGKKLFFSGLVFVTVALIILIVQPIGLIKMDSLTRKIILAAALGFNYAFFYFLQFNIGKISFFKTNAYSSKKNILINILFILLIFSGSIVIVWFLHPYGFKMSPERIFVSVFGFILIIHLIFHFVLDSFQRKNNPAPNLTEEKTVLFEISDSGTILKIPIAELYYIKSSGNYIEVIEKNNPKGHLIRHSLKGLDEGFEQLYRCHKSYIVNIDKINSIKGNSKGYEITLKEISDLRIPLARTKTKELKKIISSI